VYAGPSAGIPAADEGRLWDLGLGKTMEGVRIHASKIRIGIRIGIRIWSRAIRSSNSPGKTFFITQSEGKEILSN
jgi:hypothetical protein